VDVGVVVPLTWRRAKGADDDVSGVVVGLESRRERRAARTPGLRSGDALGEMGGLMG